MALKERQIIRLEMFLTKVHLYDLYVVPIVFAALASVMRLVNFPAGTIDKRLGLKFADTFLKYSKTSHDIIFMICAYKITIVIQVMILISSILMIAMVVYYAIKLKIGKFYGPDVIPNIDKRLRMYPFGIWGFLCIISFGIVMMLHGITDINLQISDPALYLLFRMAPLLFFSLNALLVSGVSLFIYIFFSRCIAYTVNYFAGWPI